MKTSLNASQSITFRNLCTAGEITMEIQIEIHQPTVTMRGGDVNFHTHVHVKYTNTHFPKPPTKKLTTNNIPGISTLVVVVVVAWGSSVSLDDLLIPTRFHAQHTHTRRLFDQVDPCQSSSVLGNFPSDVSHLGHVGTRTNLQMRGPQFPVPVGSLHALPVVRMGIDSDLFRVGGA